MRKLIMIAALALLSATATANAGATRSLSLASAETAQPAAQPPKTEQNAEAPPPEAAPAAVAAPPEQAKRLVVADKPDTVARPEQQQLTTEARVIYQLHRHGIYW
jgi:hypothetical protein